MLPHPDPNQHQRDDPRSTGELIRLALTEEDDDAAWDPVAVLHFRATTDVLSEAKRLCASPEAKERTLGANILGQLGIPDRAFPDECFNILALMLASESDPDVLNAVGIAFGHLREPRAVPLLVGFVQHPDCDVRFGVVSGLSGQTDERAIKALIELSSDEDSHVRDWATFELGTILDVDSHEIREALFARVTDPDDDTRGEALVGLAKRKDLRVLEPLTQELTSAEVGLLAIEAAELLADPRLASALLELQRSWAEDHDRHTGRLHQALLSCVPPVNTEPY